MGTLVLLLALGLGGLAAGILVGRYYVPDDRALKRSARHAKSYIQTINLLLERQRDEAVDVLVQVVRENVDDVEPYFALGALFRARGECERAIRVHQAIELRCANDRSMVRRVRYQLGLDFRAAGMPRRATRAMEECLLEESKHVGALKALCGLYEEQGRFADAAATWRRLEKLEDRRDRMREHHLLCAAAQRSIERDDVDSAKRFLRDAQRINEESPHFLVASAELAAARSNWKGAASRLQQALQVRPDLVSFLAGPLRAAELELLEGESAPADKERLATQETIAALSNSTQDPLVSIAVAKLESEVDEERALALFQEIADENPRLLPARVFAGRLALASGDPQRVSQELHSLVAEGGPMDWVLGDAWRCEFCGRGENHFFWRCDSCRHWGGARVDVGASPVPSPSVVPRERRLQPRLATSSAKSLPAPRLESNLSSDELQLAGMRRSALGRASSWVGGAVRKLRGGNTPPD